MRPLAWLAALSLLIGGVEAVALWLAVAEGGPPWLAAAIGSAGAALLWGGLRWALAAPVERLARDLVILARDNPEHRLQAAAARRLPALAAAIERARERLQRDSQRSREAVEAATREVALQKARLEAVLLDLDQGVIACGLDHRMLLANRAARDALGDQLGIGRSLFDVLAREPVLHHLALVLAPDGSVRRRQPVRFLCGTPNGERLLAARLVPMLTGGEQATGYVLALADISAAQAVESRRGALLQRSTEALRAPVAGLRAAVETLIDHPDLDGEARRPFLAAAEAAAASMSEGLQQIAAEAASLPSGSWPLGDLYSLDLARAVAHELAARGHRLLVTGVPLWLCADGYAVLRLITALAARILARQPAGELELAVEPDQGRVALDLLWQGAPLRSAEIDQWLTEPIGAGGETGRQMLDRHASELWSQPVEAGRSRLRLSLPPAAPPIAAPDAVPARPEFHAFDLPPIDPALALAEQPLAAATFVAFDLETTGFAPAGGDRVVAIGAVRIAGGRLRTLESFDRLVDPERAIPAASTRVHGIDDAMVAGKPPLAVALPQFAAFAGDAVLVGHNVAFDLAFLLPAAAQAGIDIRNPVLDTLLLSRFLDPEESDHSIEAVAARLGVPQDRRHEALADALLAGGILCRQLPRLAAMGLTSLGEVLRASRMAPQLRERQRAF